VDARAKNCDSSLRGGIVPDPCDRVVFATGDVVAGEFRCPTSYPAFATAGRINHYIVAFPRTAVWIERESARPFVADPGFATIYNPHQPYQRHPISPEGDLSDWLGVSERLTRDAVRQFSSRDANHPEPLRHAAAAVSSETYLIQRQLFARIAAGVAEPMEVEEYALDIMVAVLRSAYLSSNRGREIARVRRGRARRELVESAKAAILSRLFENSSVSDLAQDVDVSPYHLCRSFRAETGMTLHAYRRDIRLRTALGLTESYRGNLSALALRSGFYSHSHFTTAFRRAFGVSPSLEWHS
jgi:AraC family transcriptional regulator